MGSRFRDSTSSSSSNGSKDCGSFECNICLELAQDPIVTLCGHLYCWSCLYEWLHVHAHSPECPVCRAVVAEEKLVPLYGRGKSSSSDLRSGSSATGFQIPSRPAAQRTAPAVSAATGGAAANTYQQASNPWFVGAPEPASAGRWGSYSSAAMGGLFPLLSFQVHGFPQTMPGYGPAAAGIPYGYGHAFHGWHGHGHALLRQTDHRQQTDFYLKALLVLVGILVVATLVAF